MDFYEGGKVVMSALTDRVVDLTFRLRGTKEFSERREITEAILSTVKAMRELDVQLKNAHAKDVLASIS